MVKGECENNCYAHVLRFFFVYNKLLEVHKICDLADIWNSIVPMYQGLKLFGVRFKCHSLNLCYTLECDILFYFLILESLSNVLFAYDPMPESAIFIISNLYFSF